MTLFVRRSRPRVTKVENKLKSQNRIFIHWGRDGKLSGVGLTPESIVENWEALDFHPRARKLMFQQKPFIVIAQDAPYFKQAYDLIRYAENLKGTWTDEDERCYLELVKAPL